MPRKGGRGRKGEGAMPSQGPWGGFLEAMAAHSMTSVNYGAARERGDDAAGEVGRLRPPTN